MTPPSRTNQPENQRDRDQYFRAVDDRREQVEMRQHDLIDEIGLQWNRRVLTHQPHPIGEPGRAERRLRLVGVIGRQFPQALLPPHRADEEAKAPIAEMREGALARDRTPSIGGDADARQQ
jgi:hypothetical protein